MFRSVYHANNKKYSMSVFQSWVCHSACVQLDGLLHVRSPVKYKNWVLPQ